MAKNQKFSNLACCLRHLDQYMGQLSLRQIRIITSFASGRTEHILTRMITHKILENTDKKFIIESKAFVARHLGYEAGVRAAPDGYTLKLTDTTYF